MTEDSTVHQGDPLKQASQSVSTAEDVDACSDQQHVINQEDEQGRECILRKASWGPRLCQVRQILSESPDASSFTDKLELPEHMQQVYDNSKSLLNEKECSKWAPLLLGYQDVFAKDEFNLGTFTEI